MFSFFKRTKKIEVRETDEGLHGKHWYTLFNHETDHESILKYVNNAIENGVQYSITNDIVVIDNTTIRAIAIGKAIVTGYPRWKTNYHESFTTKSITEWSHTQSIEAIIHASHKSGFGLSFFATDYILHKEHYTKEQDIKVNIVGLAYSLELFDRKKAQEHNSQLQFSEDFCGFVPESKYSDEITIIGKIKSISPVDLRDISGFKVTVDLALESTLDIFIAEDNLTIKLEKGMQVIGLVWVQGTLET